MQELGFVPVADGVFIRTVAGAGAGGWVEEGAEFGEGGTAVAVVVAGFDVEGVAGVVEVVF